MPEFVIGARGHDFGRHTPDELFTSIGKAGFACTQLAYTKAIEGVKSYADVTPELVEATRAAATAAGVSIAVNGTYVELGYADEDKRRAEVAKVLSQIPVAKALRTGCMGSETTNMAKQPGVTRKEAQEALLRSLGEILPVCEEQGVLFAVECVYYHAMNTPEALHQPGGFLRRLCRRLRHAEADAAGRLPGPARGSRPRPRRQRHRLYAEILRINLFFQSSARCRRFQPLHRAFSVSLCSRKIHN